MAKIKARQIDTGTGPNQVVELDGSSQLPAVDGSQLTNVTASGGLMDVQTFSSSGTWNKPVGATKFEVTVVGGGGGGGGSSTNAAGGVAGGGGGGGGYGEIFLTTGVGASETVTIGAAGTGGDGGLQPGTNGSAGGTTSFGAHVSGSGGSGGQGGADGGSAIYFSKAGGGGGSVAPAAHLRISGSSGQKGTIVRDPAGGATYPVGLPGDGGDTPLGYGGRANRQTTDSAYEGVNANTLGFGGGGSGGFHSNNNGGDQGDGGNGSSGYVIVKSYA